MKYQQIVSDLKASPEFQAKSPEHQAQYLEIARQQYGPKSPKLRATAPKPAPAPGASLGAPPSLEASKSWGPIRSDWSEAKKPLVTKPPEFAEPEYHREDGTKDAFQYMFNNPGKVAKGVGKLIATTQKNNADAIYDAMAAGSYEGTQVAIMQAAGDIIGTIGSSFVPYGDIFFAEDKLKFIREIPNDGLRMTIELIGLPLSFILSGAGMAGLSQALHVSARATRLHRVSRAIAKTIEPRPWVRHGNQVVKNPKMAINYELMMDRLKAKCIESPLHETLKISGVSHRELNHTLKHVIKHTKSRKSKVIPKKHRKDAPPVGDILYNVKTERLLDDVVKGMEQRSLLIRDKMKWGKLDYDEAAKLVMEEFGETPRVVRKGSALVDWTGDNPLGRMLQRRRGEYVTDYHSVMDLQRNLHQAGIPITAESNVLDALRAFQSRLPTKLLQFQTRYSREILDPLKSLAKKLGKTNDDMLEYLGKFAYANHREARQAAMLARKKNWGKTATVKGADGRVIKQKPGDWTGMSEADALLWKARAIQDGVSDELKAITTQLNIYLREGVENLVDANVITRSQADEMFEVFGDTYVPLEGFEDLPENVVKALDNLDLGDNLIGKGKSLSVGRPGVKALGRKELAFNPFIAGISRVEKSIYLAEKNIVMQHFGELAQSFPDSRIWKVTPTRSHAQITADKKLLSKFNNEYNKMWAEDSADIAKLDGEFKFFDKNSNEMSLIINNKEYPDLINYLRGTKPERIEKLMTSMDGWNRSLRGFHRLNRWGAYATTTLNVSFALVNNMRDTLTAASIISGDIGRITAAKVLRDVFIPRSHLGVMKALRTGGTAAAKKTPLGRSAVELAENGGMVNYFRMISDLDESLATMEQLMRRGNGSFKERIGQVVRIFENYNNVFENATKVAIHKNLKEIGVPMRTSVLYARSATTDFLKKGTHAAMLNGSYMFSSAALQGNVRFLKYVATPAGMKVASSIALTSFMYDQFNRTICGREKDSGRNYMDLVDAAVKDRNILIGRFDQEPLKIPAFFSFMLFWRAGQVASEMVSSKENGMTPAKGAMDMLNIALDSSLPVGNLDVNKPASFLPTQAKYALGPLDGINMNAFNSPINPPKDVNDDNSFDFNSKWRSTEDAWSNAAEWLSLWGSPNPGYEPGHIDVSPNTLKHYFGGPDTPGVLKETVNYALSLTEDNPSRTKIPIVNRITVREPEAAISLRFYQEGEETQVPANVLKDMMNATTPDRERIERFVEANKDLLAANDLYKSLRTQIGDLRTKLDSGRLSKDLEAKIRKDIPKLQGAFLKEMNRIRGAKPYSAPSSQNIIPSGLYKP